MYGAYEAWSGSGVHLSESGINGFPIKELSHGAAVQAQWGSLYGDLEYLHSSGTAGEKEVIWFKFPAHRITSHLRYRFAKGSTEHFLRINLSWSRQTNDENVLGQEISNGITTTHVYGSNRIFERKALSVQPEYELIAPKGELRVGAEISSFKSMTTQNVPLCRVTDNDLWTGLRIRRTSCRKVRCESCRKFIHRRLHGEEQDY